MPSKQRSTKKEGDVVDFDASEMSWRPPHVDETSCEKKASESSNTDGESALFSFINYDLKFPAFFHTHPRLIMNIHSSVHLLYQINATWFWGKRSGCGQLGTLF